MSKTIDNDAVLLKIKKIKEAERIRKYYRENPDKKKKSNKKWDTKHRNEYQRQYRAKQKLLKKQQ